MSCGRRTSTRSSSRMYVSWVLGDKLRIVMSSIMRWRRGEVGLVIGGLLSVGLHERAILADKTPPMMIQLRLGRPTAKRNLRTKVSKPQKPTILDWSHQPHHRRLPRQRFSAMTRYGTGGGQVGITAPDPRAEIMARVWPNTFIEESNLKVQVPGLRRALGGVSQSRGISMARSDPLLRENAPETGNLIVPRIERWPVQLERNALTDYQNPDEPRVVSGKHYMHRPAQGHPDRLSSPNGARRAQSGRDS
jgi:hypothetical protein